MLAQVRQFVARFRQEAHCHQDLFKQYHLDRSAQTAPPSGYEQRFMHGRTLRSWVLSRNVWQITQAPYDPSLQAPWAKKRQFLARENPENLTQMDVPGITLLGVPKLDADHLQLARIIEQLSRLIESGVGRERVSMSLWELVQQTRLHFADEEQLMLSDEYPRLAVHRDEHRNLLEAIENVARDFRTTRVKLDDQLVSDLWSWVNNHIRTADQEFAQFLKTQ